MGTPFLKLTALGAALLFTACVERPLADSEPSAPSTGETEAATETDADPTTDQGGVSEPAPEPTTAPTDGAVSETEGDPDLTTTATDGMPEPPIECGQKDPSVSAALSLVLTDWPDDTTDFHHIDVQCLIETVDVVDTSVVTGLSCDVGGQPLPAALSVAVAPEGAVAWAPGQSVHLVADNSNDFLLGVGALYHVSMRRAGDDALLLVGVRDEHLEPERFAPLQVTVTPVCGLPSPGSDVPVPTQIEFRSEGGLQLDLVSGHRGELVVDPAVRFAIDVQEASTDNCCHFNDWQEVLLRRVLVDG